MARGALGRHVCIRFVAGFQKRSVIFDIRLWHFSHEETESDSAGPPTTLPQGMAALESFHVRRYRGGVQFRAGAGDPSLFRGTAAREASRSGGNLFSLDWSLSLPGAGV